MTGVLSQGTFKERLEQVLIKIGEAAKKSSRLPQDIALVAVTKGVEAGPILEAHEAGLRIFGENRVQEAQSKILSLQNLESEWHLVGHLQTNKIKEALPLFTLIQSVDSVRLAKQISDESQAAQKITKVLLEINLSGQPQRFGFSPEAVYTAMESMSSFGGIVIQGLMGIAPHPASKAKKREAFKKLRGLFQVCKAVRQPNMAMKILSMGMSDDFEMAIEEGSTMVRLGRALFGERT